MIKEGEVRIKERTNTNRREGGSSFHATQRKLMNLLLFALLVNNKRKDDGHYLPIVVGSKAVYQSLGQRDWSLHIMCPINSLGQNQFVLYFIGSDATQQKDSTFSSQG